MGSKRFWKAGVLLAVALVVVCAGVASAAKVKGDDGDNVLTGTLGPDRIMALGGNDTVTALDGPDRVNGGTGNDILSGGPGRDLIRGNLGDDQEDGGLGSDIMFAGQGVDVVIGGPGNDTIFARAKADADTPGADTVFAGPDNDLVFVRDGEPDVVACGGGFDIVFADSQDVVRPSCERVRVHAPKPGEGATE